MWNPDFRDGIKRCHDFPFERVVIQHQDGTRCEWNYAFFEESITEYRNGKRLNIIQVYTEHNGYHWYAKDDLLCYYKESMKPYFPYFNKLKRLWHYWLHLHFKKSFWR